MQLMDMPILITKLNIPACRPDVVGRCRLVERLDEGLRLHRRLTLISAPAGYGKTTLVTDWLNTRERSQVAWLSLDEADNDPQRFLSYMLASLGRAEPGIGKSASQMLQGAQAGSITAGLTLLINDLAAVEDPLVLVLDDYHLIHTPALHEALDFLINHAPALFQLVILTREDPPLALSRLRARGQLTELRAADLRFTPEETAVFFEETLGVTLDRGAIETLSRRTEGWVASLQLAGMVLQSQSEQQTFIEQFGGSHRYVIDYLLDEVLRHQPPAIREFLTQTSVLDRMCAPLCDAVRAKGTDDDKPLPPSARVLQELEKTNLFLVPLDEQRIWYRYHHLFADVLQSELVPEEAKCLHRRAAHWLANQGLQHEAIHHALEAQAFDAVVPWIDAAAGTVIRQGQIYTVLGWLNALPDQVLHNHPELAVIKALALLLSGHVDAAENQVQSLEEDIEAMTNPELHDVVVGKLYAIRAWLADAQGKPRDPTIGENALKLLPKALPHAEEPTELGDTVLFRILALIPLSHARTAAGDIQGATQALYDAYRLAETTEQPFAAMGALANLAFNLLEQGDRREMLALCKAACARYTDGRGHPLPVLGLVYLPLATAHYIGDHLTEAERYAREGLALCRNLLSNAMAGGDAERTLAQIYFARGEEERAFTLLQEAEQVAERQGVVHVATVLASTEMALRLRRGELQTVEAWLNTLSEPLPPRVMPTYQAWLLANQRWEEIESLLADHAQQLAESKQYGRLIYVRVMQAQAAIEQNRRAQAVTYLEDALAHAAPEGYRRAFLDAPIEVRRLLPHIRDGAPAFVNDLILRGDLGPPETDTSEADTDVSHATATTPPTPQPLLDPLTDQEMRVLNLLAEGLTNREIAETLVITLGTAKWHVHNVLQKLDVDNRTEAVVRAQALEIM
jgi:LuxR family maltose regulon positive regulatory protein